MLNLNELEKQWLHYKIKSYIPHAIILGSIIIISFIIVVAMSGKKDEIKSNDTNTTTIQTESLPSKAVTQNTTTGIENSIPVEPMQKVQIKSEETKVLITPSLGFMDKMKNFPTIESTVKQTPVVKAPVIVEAPAVEVIENDTTILNAKPMIAEKEISKNINIKRQNTQEDIELVIKRFKKSNNPALSLFIAKTYYEMGDYNLAYNYALITNGLDNNIEASWIIFTKSLVKLDQKDKAIATLKEYLKHSNSTNAKTLLDELVSGGMK